VALLEPFCTNDMCKVEACINGILLFDAAELIWVKEVVGSYIELESSTNNLFNEFAYCVEQDNRSKRLGCVV